MALFDQRRDAGRQIAEAVANARGRIPRTLPAPLMKPDPEPVFELGGTQTPYGPGDYSGMSTMQGYQPNITAMPNTAGPVAPAAGLGPVQQPQTGASFGLSDGISAANTLAKIPSYGDTLAPLWQAPNPGIGLNTIFSGQGPGSVAGGIDTAVNAGLGGGGLFGAAVPAAVVPGGATAATIGGAGSSAATAAFNPAWAASINPAVLAAAPIALPFVMGGLFGEKQPKLTPAQQFAQARPLVEERAQAGDIEGLLAWSPEEMFGYTGQLSAMMERPDDPVLAPLWAQLTPSTQDFLMQNRQAFTDELARRAQIMQDNPLLYGPGGGGI